MPDLDHIVCSDLAEAELMLTAIHRMSGREGRPVPYTTPLSPGDRHGPDDGSTVTVTRLTRPKRLVDGSIAIAYTANTAPLLVGAAAAPGQIAEELGLTPAQFARLKVLHNARRIVTPAEYSSDQSGIEAAKKEK